MDGTKYFICRFSHVYFQMIWINNIYLMNYQVVSFKSAIGT